jgi:hypothetical protein
MGEMIAPQDHAAQLEVRVIRANGDVEDLGIVAFHHPKWYRRAWFRLTGRGL